MSVLLGIALLVGVGAVGAFAFDQFRAAFGPAHREVRVGEPIVVAGAGAAVPGPQ